ncbi:MAG TPA: glutamate--tRNA ligase [Candidatus Saccharimonadales bacterium]|nr:glutamate--tRNA ligase [Candidatus Saccharimonadales bacterium]
MLKQDKPIRVRMAPSPTGEYHIGHIRTVLYNWAFAKKHNGSFIIRIEDTDRTRYVEGAIDRILDVITDYGFTWEEGPRVGGKYGPYIQSERLPLYRKYALELVEKKAAYYCFCTSERLEQMREEQKSKGIIAAKYDKKCLSLSRDEIEKNLAEGKEYVIRLDVPANRVITFEDVVFGKISVNTNDIDDQILLKSDGFPTYHLGVVVDDHLMEISHVMRGNDWIPSTPKHILLYEAFGWEPPVYIHLPNLKELGAFKKLSKRYGPVSAKEFLDEGYLPEALDNFLMLLGWSPGDDREVYTLDEFVEVFDIKKIHKTDLVSFDRQKLLWMNGSYIQNMPTEKLLNTLKRFYKNDTEVIGVLESEKGLILLELAKTRMKTLKDFRSFVIPEEIVLTDVEKNVAKIMKDKLEKTTQWNKEIILEVIREIIKQEKIKGSLLYKIFTGREQGLPLPESLELFGKEESIKKLEKVLQ